MQKMLSACIPQAFGKNAITLDQERISRRFRLSTLYTPKNRLAHSRTFLKSPEAWSMQAGQAQSVNENLSILDY